MCVGKRSEPSYLVTARPMIFSDETRPTAFTFANQVGVQTDVKGPADSTFDELDRTIASHLWLANLSTGNVHWHNRILMALQ